MADRRPIDATGPRQGLRPDAAGLRLGPRPGMAGPRHGPGPGFVYLGPKEKARDARATLSRLWGYLARRRIGLFLIFLLVLGSSLLTLAGPLLIGRAIDTMAGGIDHVDFQRLFIVVLELAAVFVCATVLTWFQVYFMVGIAQRTVRDLRADVFAHVQSLPLRFFDSKTHGEVMSRLTNDVEAVNATLSQSTTQLFGSVIGVTGSLVMMLVLNPLLTVLALAVIPAGMWATTRIGRRTHSAFSAQQKELGTLNGTIEEMVSGQRVVKAFGQEHRALSDFEEINGRLREAGTRAQIYAGLVPPFMNLLNNVSFAVVAGAGGAFALAGTISVGVIASFLNYSRQFARPLNEIANQYNMIQAAIAGAERVFEVLDESPDDADDPSGLVLEKVQGEVRFEDVCFGYVPGVPVLKKVNLHARPGAAVAVVGPTGAGKTTIVNLLTRFYEVDSGTIRIDGHDIRTLRKDGLRRMLGVVLQDTLLFNTTVRENIRYGRIEATDEEVEAAARVAGAHGFIRLLPGGYDTQIGEDGGSLSQGQRQMLTIARAVLANPAILVLDEATSSVDTRTELRIQKAMLALMKGRTSFVIAHRLSTIRDADEILVIDQGEIVERGDHEGLLGKDGVYSRLYQAQLRREAEIRESVEL
jgi:ATP-binding cassette, subfamily B, multidrug efflux pump